MRKLLMAGTAAVVSLALAALPAAAKDRAPEEPFTYTATIDCGSGPWVVGSHDDLWAPLVELESRRAFHPVAWDVVFAGQSIKATKPGTVHKRTTVCSYDDGMAAGTVTVLGRFRPARPSRGGGGGGLSPI